MPHQPNPTSLTFADRHVGPDDAQVATMLGALGFRSLEELMAAAVPEGIRSTSPLRLPAPVPEGEAVAELRALAGRNRSLEPMIGLGYSGTVTPAVIRRNVVEDPAWY